MFRKGENTNVIQKARIRKGNCFLRIVQSLCGCWLLTLNWQSNRHQKGVYGITDSMVPLDIAWEKYAVIRNGVTFTRISSMHSLIAFSMITLRFLVVRLQDIRIVR
jgi:hypothetical protein